MTHSHYKLNHKLLNRITHLDKYSYKEIDEELLINNKIEIIGNKNTGFSLSENKELMVPEIISTELPKITVKLTDAGKIWY